MAKIKNLIFDLGNVILNIDTNLSKIEFEKHGLADFDKLYTLSSQNKLFDKLEVGSITEEKFYEEFRSITKCNLTNDILEICWNALIMDFHPRRIEMLKELKSQYRTFILSNTNIIHYKFYTKLLQDKFRIKGLEDLVEHAYFSHEINLKKPNEDIFEYVLSMSNLNAEESLFIDDNESNIKVAQGLGFNVIWLKNSDLEKLNINEIIKKIEYETTH